MRDQPFLTLFGFGLGTFTLTSSSIKMDNGIWNIEMSYPQVLWSQSWVGLA
jgi:hypothetical protein